MVSWYIIIHILATANSRILFRVLEMENKEHPNNGADVISNNLFHFSPPCNLVLLKNLPSVYRSNSFHYLSFQNYVKGKKRLWNDFFCFFLIFSICVKCHRIMSVINWMCCQYSILIDQSVKEPFWISFQTFVTFIVILVIQTSICARKKKFKKMKQSLADSEAFK